MLRFPLLAALLALTASPVLAGDLHLSIAIPRLDVAEYHRPYLAAWIEREDNTVAGQLLVWYQLDKPKARKGEKTAPSEDGRKWLPDLRQWWRRVGRQIETPPDSIAGATRPPATHTLRFARSHAALAELPAGNYRLVVEAAREVGGRELVKIPFQWPAASVSEASAEGTSELGKVELKISP
nr:DUF2271 domain-containing protein [Pseudomarimonas arenosa]